MVVKERVECRAQGWSLAVRAQMRMVDLEVAIVCLCGLLLCRNGEYWRW